MNNRSTMQGFTLSELLVSLAVLGLIAAFAIPKVLTAVNEAGVKAVGKEAISMVSSSFDSLRADTNGFLPKSTTAADLVAKMNYVSLDTSGAAPYDGTDTNFTSSATSPVMILHNGGAVQYTAADSFVGTAALPNGSIVFNIDPDGAGNSGPISVLLGYDGRVWVSDDTYSAGTGTSVSAFNAQYNQAGNIALTVPGNAAHADTTWFDW